MEPVSKITAKIIIINIAWLPKPPKLCCGSAYNTSACIYTLSVLYLILATSFKGFVKPLFLKLVPVYQKAGKYALPALG